MRSATPPLRVLQVGKFFPPFRGGVEHYLADLMAALERQGVHSAALVHNHRRGPGEEFPPGVYRAPCLGRLLYTPISPHFRRWFNRTIAAVQPQLLAFHLPNPSAFWALTSAAARRLPWVVHWHADVIDPATGQDWRLRLAYPPYRLWEQRLLAKASAIITTSPPYLDHSVALAPWRAKATVIPLGLASARLQSPEAADCAWAHRCWGNPSGRLLAVGRLTRYKGFDVLIEALHQTEGARLLIVGEGEERPRLQRLIAQHRLQQRAELLGAAPPPALAALMASCDLLCLPSLNRAEAFGLVLLEAMFYGKAVIASAIPGSGPAWVVAEGGHGVTTPPGDATALALGIRQLLADPARRQALGQTGHQRLRRRFHIDAIAAQTAALYRSQVAPLAKGRVAAH